MQYHGQKQRNGYGTFDESVQNHRLDCRGKGRLLSTSIIEPGGPAAGKVHEYLVRIEVDYCVLRPEKLSGQELRTVTTQISARTSPSLPCV
ncbi:uncharacterized protein BT62DRAFT_930672 [Guyanagaster necrorhizus]|uniref:Uncharacterized protein n=1 Tax=Guyanagaster necrorhizus TaxID=856835 RepID=A0A9P8ATW9_9AGAR|nr:uncharacterized protein BT62DRAFT_930672 [Guyanagaster necrorhizus MCA 3950]KAG7447650.1 hypothetical protein BT62DRAFT_930672 [Guyanagaster necrorhizus MCA 3950]